MPEVSRFYGIVIRIYFDDHNPPHFHAMYGENEAVISIDSLAVLQGALPARAHGLTIEWAHKQKDDIKLWFDGLIQQIRTDYLMISEKFAPSEVTEVYNMLMEGDERKIHEYRRNESLHFFLIRICHVA